MDLTVGAGALKMQLPVNKFLKFTVKFAWSKVVSNFVRD